MKLGDVLRFASAPSDPATGTPGEVYYNTSTNKLRLCTSSAPTWTDVPGGSIAAIGDWGPNFGEANELNVGVDISFLQYEMLDAMLTSKDTWIQKPPACAGEINNRNGTDLRIDQVTTSPAESWIGFDLSNFPAGGTVVSAELILTVVGGGSSETSMVVPVFQLPNASENWGESTLLCDNAPTVGSEVHSFNLPVSGGNTVPGEYTIALSAAARTRLQNRLGQNSCSFVLRSTTNLSSAVFEDKESGSTVGPRLRMTVTVPT